MKKLYLILSLLLVGGVGLQAQRFLQPMFPEVQVTDSIDYAVNISVLSGMPAQENLFFDFYEPVGDTMSKRPIIIYFKTGSFLPIGLNATTTGSIDDYAVQRFANIAASYGYVVAVPTYRLGWNPTAATQPERAKGLLEAAYRAIQDGRSLVRFFHKDVAENGNSFRVDPDKIAAYGQGTGGYVSLAMGTLDKIEKIQLVKYLDPVTGDMLIDTSLLGDLYGLTQTPLCIPNHPGYPSDIHFAFNAAGAMGDTSWMDQNSVPIATAHSLTNIFAPSGITFETPGDINSGECCEYEGSVIVPTTGEFVTTVAGGAAIMEVANRIGINDCLLNSDIVQNDPLTQELMNRPYSDHNYWSIVQDFPEIRVGLWEYWPPEFWGTQPHPLCGDPPPDCSFHTQALQTNPHMSLDQANAYIDTLVGFFIPRAYAALWCDEPTSTEELDPLEVEMQLFPNPASNWVQIQTGDEYPIQRIRVIGIDGRIILDDQNVNGNNYRIDRGNLPPGVYFAQLQFEKGVVHRQIVFQ